MKLKQWLYGATALAMLAACSDKDIAPGGGGEEGKFSTTPGEGYLGITLQLPEQPVTRAEGDHSNDRFDDGIAAEYNIKNAALLLFWGDEDDEDNAEFVGAYTIGSDERFDNPNGDNITTSFQNVATLNKKIEEVEGKQLWGLAVVNYNPDVFIIGGNGDTTSPEYGTLKVVGKTCENNETLSESVTNTIPIKVEGENPVSGMTFSEFRKLATESALYNSNTDGLNIFMTNAPLCDQKGETNNPDGNDDGYVIQTLSKLDVTKIYDVRQTAKVNPAGCIFVERAVAKVTISEFPLVVKLKYQQLQQADDGTITSVGDNPTEVTLNITELSCIIDNEETDSYFVRNAQKGGLIGALADEDIWEMQHPDNGKYRFVGSIGMEDKQNPVYDDNSVHEKNKKTWYRTYWCKDPHYSTNKKYNDQANAQNAAYKNLIKNKVLDTSVAFYPRENTFSLANQNFKNTTRVVFRVKYEWKEGDTELNVYCRAGDPSIIYKRTDAAMFLQEVFITSNKLHDFILTYVDGAKAKANGIATDNGEGGYNIKYGLQHFDIKTATQLVTKDSEGADGSTVVTSEKLFRITSAVMKPEGALYKSLKEGTTDAEKAEIAAALTSALKEAMADANDEVKIRSFADETGGTEKNICYYSANIQHFGDTYCPMPTTGYVGITTDKVYKNDKPRYLGRWGMVRNNWYDLSISLIKNMGLATVPDGNVNTSDDNNKEEYYLSARVHVLSWAKRTQSVDF